MPEQPSDSFVADYLARQRDVYKQQIMGGGGAGVSEPTSLVSPEPEMSAFGGVIDFLSRPLYAVTNIADKALDIPERFSEATRLEQQGQTGEAFGERAGAIGSLLASPFTGFFSQSRENKNYTSDIIEKASDVAFRNYPGYVDVEDNVSPAVKGTLGFAGDLAFDPLMWIPGAQIAKGINLGLRGVRKASEAVGQAAKAAGAGKKSEKVIDTVVGAERRADTPVNNMTDVADKVPNPAQADLKLSDRIAQGIKRGDLPEDIVSSSLRATINDAKVMRGKKPMSRRNQIDSFLKSWRAGLLADDLPAVSSKLDLESWKVALLSLPNETLKSIAIPKQIGSIKLRQGNMQEFIEKFEALPEAKADKWFEENVDAMEKQLWGPLYSSFSKAYDTNPRVNLLGLTPREMPDPEAASNVISRISALAGTELKNAEEVFGRELLNSLRGLNPQDMSRFLDNSQYVLKRNGLVEGMGEIAGRGPERNLLRALGVPLSEYRAAYSDLIERVDSFIDAGPARPIDEAIDDLTGDIGFVTELTTRLKEVGLEGKDFVEDATRAISRALSYTFKRNFDLDDLAKRGFAPFKNKGEIYVTDEELGAGVARIVNSYNTGAQSDFYTKLSEEFGVLFKGVPVVDDAGQIVKNLVRGPQGERTVYEYVQLPAYIKAGPGDAAYNAYKGFDLADRIQNATIASLKSAEDFVMSKGVQIVIDVTPKGASRVVETLRFSDVIESLRIGFRQLADEGLIPAAYSTRWLQLALFHGGTGISRTHLMDAVLALKGGASRDQLLTILQSGKTRYGKKLPEGANWLAGGPKNARFGFLPGAKPKETPPGLGYEPLVRDGKLIGHYITWNNKALAENLADALLKSSNGLENIARMRKDQYIAKFTQEFNYLAPRLAQQLVRMFKSEDDARSALLVADNLGSAVIDYTKAIQATSVASMYSLGAIRNVIPRTMKTTAEASNDFLEALAKGDEAVFEARQRASRKDFDDYEANYKEGTKAADQVRENPGAYDDATREAAELTEEWDMLNPPIKDNGFGPVVKGFLRIASWLDAKWGMDVRNHLSAWLEFESLGVITGTYLSKLRNLDTLRKKYPGLADGTTPMLTAAMKELQTVIRTASRTGEDVRSLIAAQSNRELRIATGDLYAEVAKLFNVSGSLVKSALNSSFGRPGISPEALNKFFARQAVLGRTGGIARLPENGSFIDANKAMQDAADQGIDKVSAALNQWLDWDIQNPIEFLTQSNAALHQMAAETSFVDNFIRYMRKEGLSASNASEAASKGFVKISAADNTHFGVLLPDNLYLDKEAAFIFQRMDEALRPSKLLDSDFGKGIRTFFDPILNRWKTTVTVLRPGHHIRNFVGALSLRFFMLGAKGFVQADTLAARILSRRNNYKDVDMVRGMNQMTDSIPRDSEVVIRTKLGNMTARQLEDDIHKYLFIEGKRAEDLLEGDILKTRFSKGVDKFFQYATLGLGKRGGVIETAALDLSWYVQHRNITAHYIQALQQAAEATAKKPFVRGIADTAVPKNLAEARALALESALKGHPTPNMLSAWEKVFPRRLFPFYTWIKLASAAVAEASILNPARTLTTIPKASYNLAIAMGVDPYSMYSPFPTDQMFPSFMTEEMTGPQFKIDGKYVGLSPGFASLDIYNTFAGGPIEGLAGLTNPMLRVPIELLAGARLGTQAPIRDISDFLDSSIPGVNYVSNITGRSVTGLGEEQSQVARGNKTSFDQFLSAYNWLTGQGARNYSRPNYINFAEIEARNKAAEEAKKSTGFLGFLGG